MSTLTDAPEAANDTEPDNQADALRLRGTRDAVHLLSEAEDANADTRKHIVRLWGVVERAFRVGELTPEQALAEAATVAFMALDSIDGATVNVDHAKALLGALGTEHGAHIEQREHVRKMTRQHYGNAVAPVGSKVQP